MQSFGILFICFGVALILEGIAMCHGHKPYIVRGRYLFDNMTMNQLAEVGRLVTAVGVGVIIGGGTGLFYEDESLMPLHFLVIGIVISIIVSNIINDR